MNDVRQVVIVGASLAGAKAAEALRGEGYQGDIVLIGAEPDLPYERPPLSKGVLLGKEQLTSAQVHDRQWYDDHRIQLRLGIEATSLDPTAHRVTLADGETLGYDKLLLATGSRVRRLDLPGGDLDRIHYLRTSAESARLSEAFGAKPRVAVIGASWIGLETAAAARERGCEVTVIEQAPTALANSLGENVGALYADLHRRHGVDLRFSTGVEGFEGENGQVTGVRLQSGDVVPADLVVVGVGVVPNVELAAEAGLEIAPPEAGGGVITGPDLRTSADDVYAAGDIARWQHPVYGDLRVEHWSNARESAKAAAKAMLGQPVTYDAVPYFFTDMYDLGMEYVGYVPRGVSYHVVIRGEPERNDYQAFWLDEDERMLAAMHVNRWDSIGTLREIVRDRKQVDPAQLADGSIDLTAALR